MQSHGCFFDSGQRLLQLCGSGLRTLVTKKEKKKEEKKKRKEKKTGKKRRRKKRLISLTGRLSLADALRGKIPPSSPDFLHTVPSHKKSAICRWSTPPLGCLGTNSRNSLHTVTSHTKIWYLSLVDSATELSGLGPPGTNSPFLA